MRRWFSWHGLVAGLAAGAVLVFVLAAGWWTNGMPIVAAALSEQARGLLPIRVLGWFIVTFKFDAKPLGYWITMGTVVLACAAAGAVFAARRPRPWVAALVAGLAVFGVLTLVAARPSITYLSARLGAEGAANADAQAVGTVAAAIAWYGALTAVVFAFALVLLTRARPHRQGNTPVTDLGLRGRDR